MIAMKQELIHKSLDKAIEFQKEIEFEDRIADNIIGCGAKCIKCNKLIFWNSTKARFEHEC